MQLPTDARASFFCEKGAPKGGVGVDKSLRNLT
jgi:hypothetical protein